MSEEQLELLKGTLDLLVLKIVALGPSHGYAIAQRLQQISKDFFQVHQGSLYPALHRLEDRGWLQAEWKKSETGREAKFYSLTRKGRRQLQDEARNWERLCEAVARVLNASGGGGLAMLHWFRRVFHKSRAETDIDRELRFHLERQLISDNLAAGMTPDEARRDALNQTRRHRTRQTGSPRHSLGNSPGQFCARRSVTRSAICAETAASPS